MRRFLREVKDTRVYLCLDSDLAAVLCVLTGCDGTKVDACAKTTKFPCKRGSLSGCCSSGLLLEPDATSDLTHLVCSESERWPFAHVQSLLLDRELTQKQHLFLKAAPLPHDGETAMLCASDLLSDMLLFLFCSGGAACCCVLKYRGSFETKLLAQVLLEILSPFELRRLAAL